MRRILLTENMRVARLLAEGRPAGAQAEWATWLKALGEGTVASTAAGEVALPVECAIGLHPPPVVGGAPPPAPTIMDMVGHVYGDLANDPRAREPEALTRRAVLTPLNKDVDAINAKVRVHISTLSTKRELAS